MESKEEGEMTTGIRRGNSRDAKKVIGGIEKNSRRGIVDQYAHRSIKRLPRKTIR